MIPLIVLRVGLGLLLRMQVRLSSLTGARVRLESLTYCGAIRRCRMSAVCKAFCTIGYDRGMRLETAALNNLHSSG